MKKFLVSCLPSLPFIEGCNRYHLSAVTGRVRDGDLTDDDGSKYYGSTTIIEQEEQNH